MNQTPATPKDAAAVILLDAASEHVLWAQRNPQLAFLGGWRAFPGGKLEAGDAQIKIENCADAESEKFVVCAAREVFEEIGVLLARGGERLTRGQIASLHDDLISGRMNFAEVLAHWRLRIDARDFFYAGFWTTPAFSPARFKTRFFLAVCPPKQTPRAAIAELQNVEFVSPADALAKQNRAKVLISPPVFLMLQILQSEISNVEHQNLKEIAASLLETSLQTNGEIPERIFDDIPLELLKMSWKDAEAYLEKLRGEKEV